MSLFQLALASAKDIPVFPLRPGDKRPLPGSNGFKEATTDEAAIRAWWADTPDANIGLHLDGAGLCAIDIDGPGGEAAWAAWEVEHGVLPPTFTVRTPRGGRHLIFKGRLPCTASQLAPHVDTRGVDGYVVGPGSMVAGKLYTVEDGREPVELPQAVLEALQARKREAVKAPAGEVDQRQAIARARDRLRRHAPAVEGQGGHDCTYRAACLVRDVGVTEDNAPEALAEWNERCEPPWEPDELAVVIGNAYRYGQNSEGAWAVGPNPPEWDEVARREAAERLNEPGVAMPVSVTAAALRDKAFKPIRWVVDGLIPDGLTMLAAKPKVGKSWLMLAVAIAVADGGTALGRQCVQGDVLYAALEDNPRRLKERMARLVPFGPWPERLTFWNEMLPLESGGLEQLRQWIAAADKPRAVIIDVFTKVRRAKKAQEGLYDADYLAATPLKALADATGVAIVIIHHLRKMAADSDPMDAVSGSTGLTGAMDTILVINRSAQGVTLYARGRDIEEVESAIEFDRVSCRWSILGDAREVHLSAERRAILEALRAEGECSPNVIANLTGQSPANIRRLLHHMAADGEIVRLKRGLYGLPDHTPRTSVTSEHSGEGQ